MILTALALLVTHQAPVFVDIQPKVTTAAVADDPDDPAIWLNPTDPAKSIVYGTNKHDLPTGAVYAFDLNGKIVQKVEGLARPNNCDVQTGFAAGREKWSLLVVTERLKNRLLIYRIDPAGKLHDVTGTTAVFTKESGERAAPMGISCYRRPKDGIVFAIVSPKEGPTDGYLGQYQLKFNSATAKVDAAEVRRFGLFSGKKEIESVCVDDETGIVYYSDETVGTREYLADPVAPNANTQRALFNTTGTKGDHEGIAIWPKGKGGYVVCTDQIENGSEYRVFTRQSPHRLVAILKGPADSTDGIDLCPSPLGPQWPAGMLVTMNSGPKNFLMFDLAAIAKRF